MLGVTGSGKTFTMACVVERLNRPVLVISPNKVLAAQLYTEFKQFFPENAVEYFISYYDYYQPEAYIPQTDTYIEKDASINEHIDKLRLKATSSILSRKDVIAVASVSCIYNIGSPSDFSNFALRLKKGRVVDRRGLSEQLVSLRYERNDFEFKRGVFRVRGSIVDIFPADMDMAYRVRLGEKLEHITEIDPFTGDEVREIEEAWIYPASHFVQDGENTENALLSIERELKARVWEFEKQNKFLEAQRLRQRVRYDMEMIRQTGYCHGIENYSRHFSGRAPGSRPYCLLDYFPKDYILFIDESHISIPQLRAMYNGDAARKRILVDFGFRLPSALDNRPLKFSEFEKLRPATVFVSATPGKYEVSLCGKKKMAEQIIRPTGLVDPQVKILPLDNQIKSLMEEIESVRRRRERVLVLTLTKKTAEDLSEFFEEKGIKAKYMHSSMDTLKRLEILSDFRDGKFDVLVGINLLREGLDIPQVSLVAILNADNEGFLRSETTLVQISGRAARNSCGKVLIFADRMTGAIKSAVREMERRRKIQIEYNVKRGIKPESIKKKNLDFAHLYQKNRDETYSAVAEFSSLKITPKNKKYIEKELEKHMKSAADNLNFELAAKLRDRLFEIRQH